jgi:secreted PhoX family phosphatase
MNARRDRRPQKPEHMDRRSFLGYLGAATVSGLAGGIQRTVSAAEDPGVSSLTFAEVARGVDGTHHVPPGYRAEVLLRWGDPLHEDLGPWAAGVTVPASQSRRFGYNNDFIAFMPLPRGSAASDHGLLCVNHEYANVRFMWPGTNRANVLWVMDRERVVAEAAALGHSVVEVRRSADGWRVVHGRYNRRITADSPVAISGPAAGHVRMRARTDDTGTRVAGILFPCGGGKTPWGTVLIAEENFNLYFSGVTHDKVERRNHKRYGVGSWALFQWWAKHFERFRIDRDPTEANRFGWIVELDPYDPSLPPVKRTALGRFKHEAAACVLDRDGRVVIYSGDDEPFEYLYKFVSRDRFDPGDRRANVDLLDHGSLYVARFEDGGRVRWIELVSGRGGLTPENGFHDQADVLIETRRAADLAGATRMDRPEDVESNPRSGIVYVMLTSNAARKPGDVDGPNPRAPNRHGHIISLIPPGAPGPEVDHAADEFRWEVLLLAGDPNNTAHGARYPVPVSSDGWFVSPDNCAFDRRGRLWIATDQGHGWPANGFADGLWACDLEGPGRGLTRCFFRAPIGAEVCGPEFTPDGKTLFLAIQHPGIDGVPGADFSNPGTRWPDFTPGVPPRPSVLAITRVDGGEIGV